MKKLELLFLAILFACIGKPGLAQNSQVVKKYIETFKDVAIAEEIRTGVPASITLAQGIHETGAGTSDLVRRSNNHFGIKCKTEWTGDKVYHDDDAKGECFRKYGDPLESYRDHSDFLKNRPYYAALFTLEPTDYIGWAHGLKKAGYATNPKYPQILIRIIEDYNLQEFTLIAQGIRQNKPEAIYADTRKEELQPMAVAAVKRVVTFPSGLFRINETDVVYVTEGTAFLRIADEYGLSIARLFEFNDMKPADIAATDMLVFLKRKRKTGAAEFHVVAEGEHLHDIAQSEGIRLESLRDLNMLKEGEEPATGEKLYLQSPTVSRPRLAGPPNTAMQAAIQQEDKFLVHVVEPKETVFAISRKYEVSLEDVLKWNQMESNDLKAGQQLRILKK